MLESKYQALLIKKLEQMFPGCVILKNDSSYRQGIPDLVIFYGCWYAMLEVKARVDAAVRPNQQYYIRQFNNMSFARFIYPENEEAVLRELQQAFESGGHTCLSERQ